MLDEADLSIAADWLQGTAAEVLPALVERAFGKS